MTMSSQNHNSDEDYAPQDLQDPFFDVQEDETQWAPEHNHSSSTFTFDLSTSFNNTTEKHQKGDSKLYNTMTGTENQKRHYHNYGKLSQTYHSHGKENGRSVSPLVSPCRSKKSEGFSDTEPKIWKGAEEQAKNGQLRSLDETAWLSDICSEDSGGQSELEQSIWADPGKLKHAKQQTGLDLSMTFPEELFAKDDGILWNKRENADDISEDSKPNEQRFISGAFEKDSDCSGNRQLKPPTFPTAPKPTQDCDDDFSYGHPIIQAIQTSGFSRFHGARVSTNASGSPNSCLTYSSPTAQFEKHITPKETQEPSFIEDTHQAEKSYQSPARESSPLETSGNKHLTVGNDYEKTNSAVASTRTETISQNGHVHSPLETSTAAAPNNRAQEGSSSRSFIPRPKPVSQRESRRYGNVGTLDSSRLWKNKLPSRQQQVSDNRPYSEPTSFEWGNNGTGDFHRDPIRKERQDIALQSIRSSECTSQVDTSSIVSDTKPKSSRRSREVVSRPASVASSKRANANEVRKEYDKALKKKSRPRPNDSNQEEYKRKEEKIGKLIDMLMRERPVHMSAERLKTQVVERLKNEENSRLADEINLEMKSVKEKQDFEELKRLLLEEERAKSGFKSGFNSNRQYKGQAQQQHKATISSRNATLGHSFREKMSVQEKDRDTASELSAFLERASTECGDDSTDSEPSPDGQIVKDGNKSTTQEKIHPFDRNRQLLTQSATEIAEKQLLDSLADIDEKLNARQAAIRESRKRELQYKLSDHKDRDTAADDVSISRKPSLSSVAKNMLDDFVSAKSR